MSWVFFIFLWLAGALLASIGSAHVLIGAYKRFLIHEWDWQAIVFGAIAVLAGVGTMIVAVRNF